MVVASSTEFTGKNHVTWLTQIYCIAVVLIQQEELRDQRSSVIKDLHLIRSGQP